MKVESAVDIQSEGDPIAVNTDVQLPSALSIMKVASEVSCDLRWYFLCCFKCLLYVFLCMCIVHAVY
jgi:hypothetical protein